MTQMLTYVELKYNSTIYDIISFSSKEMNAISKYADYFITC